VPALLVAVAAAALLGGGMTGTVLAIVAAAAFPAMHRAHGIVQQELDAPYVMAARGLALSRVRVLLAHVVPNAVAPMTVLLLDQLALAVVLETTLSFLGLGLHASPSSLGALLANGRSAGPAIAVLVAVLGSLRTLRRVLVHVQRGDGDARP
jgi:ABC-type dipeptide/oligopeptide/nickel transport system permease subunit